jgi:hypothetical protein
MTKRAKRPTDNTFICASYVKKRRQQKNNGHRLRHVDSQRKKKSTCQIEKQNPLFVTPPPPPPLKTEKEADVKSLSVWNISKEVNLVIPNEVHLVDKNDPTKKDVIVLKQRDPGHHMVQFLFCHNKKSMYHSFVNVYQFVLIFCRHIVCMLRLSQRLMDKCHGWWRINSEGNGGVVVTGVL